MAQGSVGLGEVSIYGSPSGSSYVLTVMTEEIRQGVWFLKLLLEPCSCS